MFDDISKILARNSSMNNYLSLFIYFLSGWTSLGDLSSFVILIESAKTSAKEIFEIYQDTMKTTTYVQKAFNLMERGSQIVAGVGTRLVKGNILGEIELRNVTFTYPSRPSVSVLRDLNITLLPGRVTAVCGASGRGEMNI